MLSKDPRNYISYISRAVDMPLKSSLFTGTDFPWSTNSGRQFTD